MIKCPLSAAPSVFAAQSPEFSESLGTLPWAEYWPSVRPGRQARNAPAERLPDCLVFRPADRRDNTILSVALDSGRVVAKNSHRGRVISDDHIYRIVRNIEILGKFYRPSVATDLLTLWDRCICLFLERRQAQAPFFRITGRIKGTNLRPDIPNSVWENLQYYKPGSSGDFIGWAENVIKSSGDTYVDVKIYFSDKSASIMLKNNESFTTLNDRERLVYFFLSEEFMRSRYPHNPLRAHFEWLRTIESGLTLGEFWRAWTAVCETSIKK
jgi:hypothetical protein